ncbi:hypothetical protein [Bordetella genomosp. 5]|uniref:hypothetical protein n=1 Tax=Bordetella genomosp. 5 TaxID=1395608 RepID=UPI0015963A43|nr:hypothetical protein [Bordetella genomosp. 5]
MTKTVFKEMHYSLDDLIGNIGLPNIQRPFVWANAKVRDLFDSMYRGNRSATSCIPGESRGGPLRPTAQGQKTAQERHHLFPKQFLKKQSMERVNDINQIANYALVECERLVWTRA